MTQEATLEWQSGEKEACEASLFGGDFPYFVTDEELADYRKRASSMTRDEWKAVFDKGGFYMHVCVGLAPKEVALELYERLVKEDPKTYYPMGAVLAVLGAGAVPVMMRFMERAVAHIGEGVYSSQIEGAVRDIQPVAAPALVPLVARVLTAKKAKRNVKASAAAWLRRHAGIAREALAGAMANAPKAERAAVEKALAEDAATSGGSVKG